MGLHQKLRGGPSSVSKWPAEAVESVVIEAMAFGNNYAGTGLQTNTKTLSRAYDAARTLVLPLVSAGLIYKDWGGGTGFVYGGFLSLESDTEVKLWALDVNNTAVQTTHVPLVLITFKDGFLRSLQRGVTGVVTAAAAAWAYDDVTLGTALYDITKAVPFIPCVAAYPLSNSSTVALDGTFGEIPNTTSLRIHHIDKAAGTTNVAWQVLEFF